MSNKNYSFISSRYIPDYFPYQRYIFRTDISAIAAVRTFRRRVNPLHVIGFFPYPLKTSENIRGFLMGNYVVHVAFNGNKILSTFFYFLLVPSECKILSAKG